MIIQPIFPYYGKTQNAVVAGAGSITGLPGDCKQLLLTNFGTQVLFVRVQQAADATAASAADMPILPNTQVVITKDSAGLYTKLGYFAGAAGSTLYVTPCEGFA